MDYSWLGYNPYDYGLFFKSPEHSVHKTCGGMFQINNLNSIFFL